MTSKAPAVPIFGTERSEQNPPGLSHRILVHKTLIYSNLSGLYWRMRTFELIIYDGWLHDGRRKVLNVAMKYAAHKSQRLA